MNSASRLVRNFVTLFLGSTLGQLFFFGGTVYLARRIGPEAFGWWSFAQALVFYLLRVNEFGLEVTGIRAVAKDPELIHKRVSAVMGIRTVLAILLLAVTGVVLTLGLVPEQAVWLVAIFSLTLVTVSISLEWLFEAQQSVTTVGVARIFKGILFAVPVVMLVWSTSDVELSAAMYVWSMLLPAVYVLVVAWRRFHISAIAPTFREARELLVESWPIAAATILSQYSLFFGTTLLGYVAGGEEVGIYSAAHRMVLFVWAYGITVSHRVLLPSFSRVSEQSLDEFQSLLSGTLRFMVIMGVPIVAVVGVVSSDVINLFYGEGYSISGSIFGLLLWALVIGILRSPLDIALIASHRQSIYLRGMVLYGLLHTVGGVLGYFYGGLHGLALGAIAAEAGYALYLVLAVKDILKREMAVVFAKPFLGGALAFGIMSFLEIQWLALLIIGSLVYVGSLVAFRELTRPDWELLKQLVGVTPTRQDV